MANAGYDVWMANNRGTRWSNQHTDPNISEFDYWQFEWEDMGMKDDTAVIDYILKVNGASQITYVGHSEGTAQILAASTLIPEYFNSKIKACVLLGPPAAVAHIQSKLMQFLASPHIIGYV